MAEQKTIDELISLSTLWDDDILPVLADWETTAQKVAWSVIKDYVKTWLTTNDVTASTNKKYVTDAQLVVIWNTSWSNTWDNATNSQYSGLATSKQDTLVSWSNIKTVNSNSLLWSGDLVIASWWHVIQDEWTPLTTRANLNFVWAWVTVTDDSWNNATVVTIPEWSIPWWNDTEIQFNDWWDLSGDSTFTFNKTTKAIVSTWSIQIDNIKIDWNTISSTNTNWDINLTPNWTWEVILSTMHSSTSAWLTIHNNWHQNVALFWPWWWQSTTFYDWVKLDASTWSRILSTDSNKNITALDTGTYPDLTELSYVKWLTWPIETRITQFPVDINRYWFISWTTTLTFDWTNTITVAPVSPATTWSYYRTWLKHTITGSKSVVLDWTPVTTWMYYIYIDWTAWTLVSWGAWTLNDTKVPVATLYFNDTLTPKYVFTDERHTTWIDRAYHREHHFTEWTEYVPWTWIPSWYTLNTPTDAGNTFGISEAKIFDEDLALILSELTDPNWTWTPYFVPYRTASTTYVWAKSDMPFLYDSLGWGAYWYIKYDNAWTLTASANNRYINYFLFLSNARAGTEATQWTSTDDSRFMMIPWRTSHTTTASAYSEAPIISAWFPVAEWISIYQITFSTLWVADSVKWRCQINRVQEIQSVILSTSTVSTADHNTLANLQLSNTWVTYWHVDDQAQTIYWAKTFNSDVVVPDESYWAWWDTNLEVPTKNAVYDKIQTLSPLASPTFTGTVTLPTTVLWEASFQLDPTLSADGKWSWITTTGTAWATLVFWDLCYFQASDSRWEKVDANVSAWYDKRLWICVLASANDWDATEMLLIWKIRADSKFPTMTIWSAVYMSETAGEIVVTQPSTADVCIRVVWFWCTADELWFNPSNDYIVHV